MDGPAADGAQMFEVVRAVAEELPDGATFVVALARDADGCSCVQFQMGLPEGRFDEQDVRLGMDSYAVVMTDGACEYACVESCVQKGDLLTIGLMGEGARILGVPRTLHLRLLISMEQRVRVMDGLRRVLTCGRGAPDPLILEAG